MSGTIVKVGIQTRRKDGTVEVPVWVYSVESAVKLIVVDAGVPGAPPVAVDWIG